MKKEACQKNMKKWLNPKKNYVKVKTITIQEKSNMIIIKGRIIHLNIMKQKFKNKQHDKIIIDKNQKSLL